MTPRTEFVLLGGAAAGLAAVLATALGMAGNGPPWTDALKWLLPAGMAGALGNAWVSRGNTRLRVKSAGALALRAVLFGVIAYLALAPLYVLAAFGIDSFVSGSRVSLSYFPLALLISLVDLSWAIVPLSLFQYALCRRHLRRVHAITGSK